MTDTRTPDREPEMWFQGKMRPRSEVKRLQREEAAQMAGPVVVDNPPPRGPAQMPAAVRGETPEAVETETVRSERGPGEDPAPATRAEVV